MKDDCFMWRKIQVIHSASITFYESPIYRVLHNTNILHLDTALSEISQWIPLYLLKRNKIRIEISVI